MFMRWYVGGAAALAVLCACEPASVDFLEEPSGGAGIEAESEQSQPADPPAPCDSVMCQNNGKCLVDQGQAQCFCPIGFTGPMCEEDTNGSEMSSAPNPGVPQEGGEASDPCSDTLCQNDGDCLVRNGEARCSCMNGFSGMMCEVREEVPWPATMGDDDHGRWASFQVGTVSVRMRQIPAGTFLMGAPDSESGLNEFGIAHDPDDQPQHEVTLTKGFWIAETECTQALWEVVMGSNPSSFISDDRPVEKVSSDDTKVFFQNLNKQVPGLIARLPTEAEWEYAARAGTTGQRYGDLDAIAWYGGDYYTGTTHPVAQKLPNAWGLYDTLGNVEEWVADAYDETFYSRSPAVDPLNYVGDARVYRGGDWYGGDADVTGRSGQARTFRDRCYGFRIARSD